jgi:hypothetical protein
MTLDQTTVSPSIAAAVKTFEAAWAELLASDGVEEVWQAGYEAWEALMQTRCETMGDVVAKAAAFTVYREGETDWGFDTLNDADFPHLAALFGDARRLLAA